MVEFKVRVESLADVASLLDGACTVFDTNVTSVDETVSRVVSSGWNGDDSDAFQASWTDWKAQAAALRATLSALSGQLVAASGQYTSTDSGLGGGFVQERGSVGTVSQGISGGVGRRVSAGLVASERPEGDELDEEQRPAASTGLLTGPGVAGQRARGSAPSGRTSPTAEQRAAEQRAAENA
ncbi:WXG100 family type VII secretion target [Mycetocola reblochoni]|uniref:WXG100 family type VII secretion target n=1 Tax=Mycetocola reblochoni REB411 TaxID=1255698 RepID=A0A1R4K211_9MICO|nr:WXG100 family type VII secretion target [Mycetocola reblochoni]SJN38501.1 hypothetical protein FM119_10960 [Mycetocola reblochoni REB411]